MSWGTPTVGAQKKESQAEMLTDPPAARPPPHPKAVSQNLSWRNIVCENNSISWEHLLYKCFNISCEPYPEAFTARSSPEPLVSMESSAGSALHRVRSSSSTMAVLQMHFLLLALTIPPSFKYCPLRKVPASDCSQESLWDIYFINDWCELSHLIVRQDVFGFEGKHLSKLRRAGQ